MPVAVARGGSLLSPGPSRPAPRPGRLVRPDTPCAVLSAQGRRWEAMTQCRTKRLTENELSDFSRLWHDGCGKAIIETQDVDRNHSPEI